MRFHVPCLPHTMPTKEYAHCAYTQKLLNFEKMMTARGHDVFMYTSESALAPELNLSFPYDGGPIWVHENNRAIEGIRANLQPQDIICLIAGRCQEQIANAFPEHLSCEFGIGYFGTFAKYCVYESNFHRAVCHGRHDQGFGRFFDDVIPNYYDLADFPVVDKPKDYLLFVGRLNDDKGIHVAADIAGCVGLPLHVAGQGTPPAGCFYHGLVKTEKRAELMGNAIALLAPTLYLEPFGGVATECQLTGTPAITTDWGGFVDTVEHGVTGYRCHYLGEFVRAVEGAKHLDRQVIASRARSKYSLEAVGLRYETYFKRLLLLHGEGWYTRD